VSVGAAGSVKALGAATAIRTRLRAAAPIHLICLFFITAFPPVVVFVLWARFIRAGFLFHLLQRKGKP
jgi:hypothetical protein